LYTDLEQIRAESDRLAKESMRLAESLKKVEAERDSHANKLGNMKRDLINFQDETRSRVKKFVEQRDAMKSLLEQTLDQNRVLTAINEKLEKSLGRTKDETKALGDKHSRLQSSFEQLQESHSRAFKLLHKARDEINNLFAENRDLRVELDELLWGGNVASSSCPTIESSISELGPHGKDPGLPLIASNQTGVRSKNDRLPDEALPSRSFHSNSGKTGDAFFDAQRANEIAALIALSAKKSMEQSNAQSNLLKAQVNALTITSASDLKALLMRIRLLEARVGESVLSEQPSRTDEKEPALDALHRRIESLEKRVAARQGRYMASGLEEIFQNRSLSDIDALYERVQSLEKDVSDIRGGWEGLNRFHPPK